MPKLRNNLYLLSLSNTLQKCWKYRKRSKTNYSPIRTNWTRSEQLAHVLTIFCNFLGKTKAIFSMRKAYFQLDRIKDFFQASISYFSSIFFPLEFQLAFTRTTRLHTSTDNMVWRIFYNLSWIWIRDSNQSRINTPTTWKVFCLLS